MQGTGMSHVKAEQDGNASTGQKADERVRFLDAMPPLPGHSHILEHEELQPLPRGITRERRQPLTQFLDKGLLAKVVCCISHAQCPDMAAGSKGAKMGSKINGAFIPAHGGFPHCLIWMQQLAPGVRCQAGEGAVQEDTPGSSVRAYGIGIAGCRDLVKHRVHQIQAELAAVQAEFLFHDGQPLLRFRPALHRKACIDAKV